ncbi:MAG: SPOR domain-containing protein [Candidatus Sulfobium sp.]|jgi:twitching motility two-component system response regulator PilH
MDPKRKRKVLIVDDEQSVRDLFVRTLEPAGFDVLAVANPDEGIERANLAEPDIIYLSLLFPESNGLKVSKSMHSAERLKEVPIVVLISYEGELDPKYTRTIGIVDVVVKPLKPADILATTGRLLGEEISFEAGKPAGAAREEAGEEVPVAVEGAGLFPAGGDEESMSKGREMRTGSEEGDFAGAAEGIEGAENKSDRIEEPAGEEEVVSPDFGIGGKEDITDEDLRGSPAEDKEEDRGGFPIGGERPPGYAEEGGTDEMPDYMSGKTGRRETRKYYLFAALVLLVAVVVFATLQSGIFSGGSRKGKLFPQAAEETPVKKETVTEAVQPGQVEDKVRADSPAKEKVAGEERNPSSETSAHRKDRAVAGEKKALNEELKEPKALRGQQKETYSIQVGAFKKAGNAASLAKRLKDRGYDSFVEKGGGAGLHRVFVGRFDDYGEARRVAGVLLKKDGIKSIIYRH